MMSSNIVLECYILIAERGRTTYVFIILSEYCKNEMKYNHLMIENLPYKTIVFFF